MWDEFFSLLLSPAGVLTGLFWALAIWIGGRLVAEPFLWLERRRLARMRAAALSPQHKDSAR